MYQVDILPRAQEEYEQSIFWYRERNYRASEYFMSAIEETLNSIEKNPFQFKKILENYFEAIVQDYPFSIVFIINETEFIVEVVAIYHQSRNPNQKFRSRKS